MKRVRDYLFRLVPAVVLFPFFVATKCPAPIAKTVDRTEAAAKMKDRWFFSFGNNRTPEGVAKIKSLIDIAAEHNLNGMVLSSFGLDSITRWNRNDIALLQEVADYCKLKGIELIPTGFSAGYGGGALSYNRNFSAALPATVFLEARAGRLVPAHGRNLLINGDMEKHNGDRFKGWTFIDKPGELSFADSRAAQGNISIRFEGFGKGKAGNGRMMQKVPVQAGRSYRVSFQIKTEKLQPFRSFKIMVNTPEGKTLASSHPVTESTQDWTKVTLDFISRSDTDALLYAGIWNGKSGKFWLDDFQLYEYNSLSDVVRRKGTPLKLTSQDRKATFEEGKDFEVIRSLRNLPSVKIPSRSSIREGERLELSCYKIPYVNHSWGRQISLCMSNPELYDYWQAQAKKLHEVIKFKRYLLEMDEVRNGGGCLACKERGISMAQILGDCITRQHAIFKQIDPEIEVLIWSDMLDPAHNARNNFYGVVGDFTGSWKYVPKDLVIMCWYHEIRDESLGFFSKQGFRTIGAAYYDADDLASSKEWLISLKKTAGSQGIMYTTWEDKYELLADFGELVSQFANEH